MGVELVSFTPDATKVVACAGDDQHTIVIYDLTDKVSRGGSQVLEQKGGRETMLELRWKNSDVI